MLCYLQTQADSEAAVDSTGVAGWDMVDALTEALLSPSEGYLSATSRQRDLYSQLSEFDRKPIVHPCRPRHLGFVLKRSGF